LRTGQLRHRVTIQVLSSTRDSYGSFVETWTDEKTVWAGVFPLRGREYLMGQQMESAVEYKVVMRYTDDVTPGKRLQIGDSTRYLDIKSIINPGLRNIELELMCAEAIDDS